MRVSKNAKTSARDVPESEVGWTFLSNHTHVLVVLAKDSSAQIQDISAEVGITYRAVQRILAELAAAGVLTVEKQGRRNEYRINRRHRLHHPLESHRKIGDLLAMLE